MLFTRRYWAIRDITPESGRQFGLVCSEIEHQAKRLNDFADELERIGKGFGQDEGTLAVPDTNLFLHFQMFDTIDWRKLLAAASVRLVIPISV